MLPELRLAARVSQRFYRGQIFGDNVLERMVSLTAQSASFRELMSDLFAGIQGYRDLCARLYRILPTVMANGACAGRGTQAQEPRWRRNPNSQQVLLETLLAGSRCTDQPYPVLDFGWRSGFTAAVNCLLDGVGFSR